MPSIYTCPNCGRQFDGFRAGRYGDDYVCPCGTRIASSSADQARMEETLPFTLLPAFAGGYLGWGIAGSLTKSSWVAGVGAILGGFLGAAVAIHILTWLSRKGISIMMAGIVSWLVVILPLGGMYACSRARRAPERANLRYRTLLSMPIRADCRKASIREMERSLQAACSRQGYDPKSIYFIVEGDDTLLPKITYTKYRLPVTNYLANLARVVSLRMERDKKGRIRVTIQAPTTRSSGTGNQQPDGQQNRATMVDASAHIVIEDEESVREAEVQEAIARRREAERNDELLPQQANSRLVTCSDLFGSMRSLYANYLSGRLEEAEADSGMDTDMAYAIGEFLAKYNTYTNLYGEVLGLAQAPMSKESGDVMNNILLCMEGHLVLLGEWKKDIDRIATNPPPKQTARKLP